MSTLVPWHKNNRAAWADPLSIACMEQATERVSWWRDSDDGWQNRAGTPVALLFPLVLPTSAAVQHGPGLWTAHLSLHHSILRMEEGFSILPEPIRTNLEGMLLHHWMYGSEEQIRYDLEGVAELLSDMSRCIDNMFKRLWEENVRDSQPAQPMGATTVTYGPEDQITALIARLQHQMAVNDFGWTCGLCYKPGVLVARFKNHMRSSHELDIDALMQEW